MDGASPSESISCCFIDFLLLCRLGPFHQESSVICMNLQTSPCVDAPMEPLTLERS